MERRPFAPCWALFGALALFAGCGQAPAAKPSAATAASDPQAKSSAAKQAVQQFLEAVRKRNDAEARQWLTALAREKTKDMEIAPPGSETAQFEVGAVELVEGGAHVASSWSDVDADNVRHTEPIVWVVANEPEGWRICGMATTMFEEKLPIVLNFEDPEEMAQKQQMIEAEAARRAAQPANPSAQAAAVAPPAGNPAGNSAGNPAGNPAAQAEQGGGASPGRAAPAGSQQQPEAADLSSRPAAQDRQASPPAGPTTRNALRDAKRQ